jgi:S-adenosylmethionine:diacylglycerol 3-amino-3-carboxypropyl transferase
MKIKINERKVTEREDRFLIVVDGREYLTDPQGNGLWRKLAKEEQFEMEVKLRDAKISAWVKYIQIAGRETFQLRRAWTERQRLQAVREWFKEHPPTEGLL